MPLIPPCGVSDLNFQKSLKPLRCQRTTVSGLTITRDLRQGLQIRESKTQKSRSAIRILGLLFVLFITANCWRSARFSAARFAVILNFDQMNKTRLPSIFIMIIAWQEHANLSMISECTNNCEGQPFNHLAFFLLCQISKYLSQVFPEVFKYSLFTILRNPYDVILAFPLRVA